jgi:hypothetical protein
MARRAGAKKVYFASAAPPVRHPNVYGIDMPSCSDLIAASRSEKEVEKLIGADWLIYQSLEDLIECVSEENPSLSEFDSSIFDGIYVTGDIDQRYLLKLDKTRTRSCPSRNGGFRFRPRPQRFRNRRRSQATPRIAKSENAGMGRKTAFMDGHTLENLQPSRWCAEDRERGAGRYSVRA